MKSFFIVLYFFHHKFRRIQRTMAFSSAWLGFSQFQHDGSYPFLSKWFWASFSGSLVEQLISQVRSWIFPIHYIKLFSLFLDLSDSYTFSTLALILYRMKFSISSLRTACFRNSTWWGSRRKYDGTVYCVKQSIISVLPNLVSLFFFLRKFFSKIMNIH